MDKSKVKIEISTPSGKLSRTMSEHKDLDELLNNIETFINETHEAIETGTQIYVECSKCCNNNDYKGCFKKFFRLKK